MKQIKTLYSKSLYFLAFVANEEISAEVLEFKKIASHKFRSSRALNSPAHITFLPPFFYDNDSISDLENELQEIIKGFKSSTIFYDGFGHFGKKVIFINIELNGTMKYIFRKLTSSFEHLYEPGKFNCRFHPHMTVAFKDMKEEVFPEAWDFFGSKELKRTQKFNSLSLLKFMDKKWIVVREFSFGE